MSVNRIPILTLLLLCDLTFEDRSRLTALLRREMSRPPCLGEKGVLRGVEECRRGQSDGTGGVDNDKVGLRRTRVRGRGWWWYCQKSSPGRETPTTSPSVGRGSVPTRGHGTCPVLSITGTPLGTRLPFIPTTLYHVCKTREGGGWKCQTRLHDIRDS